MLQILSAGGDNLVAEPPVLSTRPIAGGTTAIGVYAAISENDQELPFQLVGATLDWNDGSQPIIYPPQPGPLIINTAKALSFGTYAITVTAHNNRAPVNDVFKVTFPWLISQLSPQAPAARNIFGPVLPRDDGLPNDQTWNFDTGSDLQLLQSNLKMLLLTAKGERIMQPNYGTNLRRVLFELNVASIETIIQQEINQAIATYEPRVTIQNLTVQRNNDRSVNVAVSFLSRQNGRPFPVNLQFAQ